MTMQELSTLYHCIFSLHYHLVLVTKYRRKCITTRMLARLREIFAENARKWECELKEFNGEADHVQMVLALNPKVPLSVFVNNMKTVSSRLIRKEFPQHLSRFYRKPVFWSRSYCILTVGGPPVEILKQYIEQQGTHN